MQENMIELYSNEEGYVESIDAEKLGIASMLLGGGRAKKEDSIDYGVGVIVHKKVGDFVNKDEAIATIHANDLSKFEDVKATIERMRQYRDNLQGSFDPSQIEY
jgi:pyrimidine-nucleoside phosphorylase